MILYIMVCIHADPEIPVFFDVGRVTLLPGHLLGIFGRPELCNCHGKMAYCSHEPRRSRRICHLSIGYPISTNQNQQIVVRKAKSGNMRYLSVHTHIYFYLTHTHIYIYIFTHTYIYVTYLYLYVYIYKYARIYMHIV